MAKNSYKDIMKMEYNDFLKFTTKENFPQFKTILQAMSKEANRRIRELKASPIGKYSPAYKHLREDEGISKFKPYKRISTKKRNELIHEFSTMKKFLEAKSSTTKGWNQVRSRIGKRIKTTGMFKTEFKSKRQASYWIKKEESFWSLYNKLVDEYGSIISQLDSKRIQKVLARIQRLRNIGNNDEIVQEAMEDYINRLYLAKQNGYKMRDDEFIENEVRLKYV